MTDKKRLLHFFSWVISFYLFLFILIFLIYLVAPILGGKLHFNALIVYGSWIGLALILKNGLKDMQKEMRLKKYKFILLTLYYILCAFLWFSYPLNLLFSGLFVVSNIVGYKAQYKL